MGTPNPHGGKLVNRVLSSRQIKNLVTRSGAIEEIVVREESLRDAANIARGIFSPLEGFLRKNVLTSVLDDKRLPDDTPWTMPILLDVSEDSIRGLDEGDWCLITDPQRTCLARVHIDEIFTYDKKTIAEKVFGTMDPSHPGVASTLGMEDTFLGGKVDLVGEEDSPFDRFRLDPAETRVLFREKGWRTIVGFQTRNPPHLGHEWIQKIALTFSDGVFINPLIGKKKSGDFRDELTLEAYDCLIKDYYLKERAVLSILRTDMKYAGPREAIHHAIIRKNFGCTHFIVGRDHAGVSSFYDPFAAQDMFEEFPDLGIVPMFFSSFFHCSRCGGIANEKTCPHNRKYHTGFSGTDIRRCVQKGERPRKDIMREEIADIILSSESPFVE